MLSHIHTHIHTMHTTHTHVHIQSIAKVNSLTPMRECKIEIHHLLSRQQSTSARVTGGRKCPNHLSVLISSILFQPSEHQDVLHCTHHGYNRALIVSMLLHTDAHTSTCLQHSGSSLPAVLVVVVYKTSLFISTEERSDHNSLFLYTSLLLTNFSQTHILDR